MRFLPSMDPNVFLKVASIRKSLITFIALMRFLPSMDPNVKMFDHIPCIDEVSPQYGSYCDYSDCFSGKIFI